jgi:phage terminase large subunit-like protein
MNNHDEQIRGITYSEDLSKTHGITVKNMFDLNHDLLGLSISSLKRSTSDFMFDDNNTGRLCTGNINMIGKNSSITGKTITTAILDDLYNPKELLTKSVSEIEAFDQLNKWFDDVLLDRIDIDTDVFIVHTRFGKDDLIGRILDDEELSKEYDYYNFKAISDKWEKGFIYPEKYNKNFFLKKQKQNPRLFETRYQGVPPDALATGWFNEKGFENFTDEIPTRLFFSVDLAFTKNKTSKFTSWIIAGVVADRIVICDVGEIKTQKTLNYIKLSNHEIGKNRLHSKLHLPIWLIERQPAGAGKNLEYTWDLDFKENGYRPIIWIDPDNSKETRSFFLQELFDTNRVWFHNDLVGTNKFSNYKNKMLAFPDSDYSDFVDATSQFANYIFKSKQHTFGILTDSGEFM